MRKNIFIYSVFAFLAFASVSCVKESSAVEGTSATGSVEFRICGNDGAVTKGWTGDPGQDSAGLLEEDIDNYVTTLDIYAFNASTGALVWRSEHYVSDYANVLNISNPFTGWNNAEFGLYDVIAVANIDKDNGTDNYKKITSLSSLNSMLVTFGTSWSTQNGTTSTGGQSGTILCTSHDIIPFSSDGSDGFPYGTYNLPGAFVMASPITRITVNKASQSISLKLERLVSKIIIRDIHFDSSLQVPPYQWNEGSDGIYMLDVLSFTRACRLVWEPATGYDNLGANYQTYTGHDYSDMFYDGSGANMYDGDLDDLDNDEYGEEQLRRFDFMRFDQVASGSNITYPRYTGSRTFVYPPSDGRKFLLTAYVLPNRNIETIKMTRVYIGFNGAESTSDGRIMYYPIVIPQIGRNEIYDISDVTIKSYGTNADYYPEGPFREPDNPADPVTVSYTLTVKNWSTGAVKSIQTVGSRGSVDTSGNVTY